MAVDDATWSEIRRSYRDGGDAVAILAARFGVSAGAIWYRARRDGWGKRRERPMESVRAPKPKPKPKSKLQPKPKPQQPGRSRAGDDDGLVNRDVVVARLYRAIVKKLDRLEDRMDDEPALTPADSERETRELATMVRSFEKVTGVAADIAKERKPKVRGPGDDAADAERMGLEIARRLEALNAQWDAEQGSGDA